MDPNSDLRYLGVALHDLSWAVRHAEQDPDGLTPLPPTEFQVMRQIGRTPGASVGQVAAALGLQQPNVSAAVRGLVQRGLVERTRDPHDRRITRLHSTALSSAHRDPVETGWGHALAGALDRLDANDRQAVLDAIGPLQRLAVALSENAQGASADDTAPSPVAGSGR